VGQSRGDEDASHLCLRRGRALIAPAGAAVTPGRSDAPPPNPGKRTRNQRVVCRRAKSVSRTSTHGGQRRRQRTVRGTPKARGGKGEQTCSARLPAPLQ